MSSAGDLDPDGADEWSVPDEDRRRVVSRPTTVGHELAGLVRRRRWRQRLDGIRVFEQWHAIAGAQLASRCEPVRLAGGTLVVRAESPLWATQLSYMLTPLRDRAATVLGEGMVTRIKVVVGPLQGTAASRGRDGQPAEDPGGDA